MVLFEDSSAEELGRDFFFFFSVHALSLFWKQYLHISKNLTCIAAFLLQIDKIQESAKKK